MLRFDGVRFDGVSILQLEVDRHGEERATGFIVVDAGFPIGHHLRHAQSLAVEKRISRLRHLNVCE